MTSIVFTQFEDDLPVDVNKEYYIDEYQTDIGLQEIHKLCLFPEKLREYLVHLESQDIIEIINSKTDFFEHTPLNIACINGVTESVELLIKYGADVNVQDQDSYTPLMYMYLYNIKIVNLLLDAEADINIQNIYGETALMLACDDDNNNIECVKLLLDYGADINIQNDEGDTALMYTYNIECVKLLLDYGADINIQNKYGNTALMYACNIECVKLLLQIDNSIISEERKIKTNILNTATIILSNIINCLNYNLSLKQLKKLNKFDYNSILLYELKKCVF